MKTNTMRVAIISLITVGLVAVGTIAFAGRGMGYREGGCPGEGYGRYQKGYDCPHGRQAANLTDEQRQQLDAERQAFFEATQTQRQDLHAKRLALRAEMVKRNPDMKKAASLQKEISDLQAGLDQKRLTHIAKMREINPDAGMGFYGGGRGWKGHGHGRGYGSGSGCNRY